MSRPPVAAIDPAAPAAGTVAFSLPIRVYWEDTDAGGVTYHAAYVCFLERARSEWLRALGVSQQALREADDVVFAVRGMTIDFHAPARLDDALEAQVVRVESGRASLVFHQRILRPGDARVLVEAEVRAACLTASTFRPRALPPWLQALVRHSKNEVS